VVVGEGRERRGKWCFGGRQGIWESQIAPFL
jgi:hypothetical protein